MIRSDGTVADQQKISDTEGGFTGVLNDYDFFGSSITRAGDLNDDGVPDLAVGAFGDDDGGTYRGVVWMLFGEEALLPVELASFEGTRSGESEVALKWQTASETGSAGFQIQHRRGGEHESDEAWEKIGFVD